VTLAASGSSNTITQPVATTDLNGQTTGTVSSTAAEVKTVSATANGVGVTQTASVTVSAAAAASMALNAGDNQSAVVNTAVAVAPSVIVRDAFNNVVQGTPVTFAVGSGGGNVAPVTPVLTDINGIASATWTLGTVVGTNNNTLTATSSGLTGSPVTFTASATVGAPRSRP
jgi:adhesin/invasin